MSKKNEKQRRKKPTVSDGYLVDNDDTFAFIAGYTSGGAPYGITWKDMDSGEDDDSQDEEEIELPFD